MDIAVLTSVFGWMTLLNLALLAFSAAFLMLGRGWVTGVHSRMIGIPEDELNRFHFSFLANYKIAIIILNLVPYLALRIVG